MDAGDASRVRRPDQRQVRHGVSFQAEQVGHPELAVVVGQQRGHAQGGQRVRRPGDRQRGPRQEAGRHPGRVRVEGQQRRAAEPTQDAGLQVHAQSETDVHVCKCDTRTTRRAASDRPRREPTGRDRGAPRWAVVSGEKIRPGGGVFSRAQVDDDAHGFAGITRLTFPLFPPDGKK